MGRLLLVCRLVTRDIRRRPVQSALLLVVIVTTTTTLALALTLRHVAQNPFARTQTATKGPDMVFDGQLQRGARLTATAGKLRRAPGVAAVGGPFPLAFVRLTDPGIDVPVDAEGRTSAPVAVNQPLVTVGHWVQPGSAVIEQGLAGALGLHVGDRIHLRGQSFRVAGIALQTEQPFYPASSPGLVWVTPGDAARLATRSDPLGYEFDLKLTHPSATDAFFSSRAAMNAFPAGTVIGKPWQVIRKDDYRVVTIDQKAMLIGAWLLGILAIASIAVVVGGRMTEQTRRVGLLKAVGATPRLVAIVLLAENLLLALAGTAVGLLAARVLIPSLADPGSGLLGTPSSPPITLTLIAEVALAAVVIAMAATILPAVRGARMSTIRALHDPARPPHRRPWLIALSARLPVPLLLGVRLIARRTRRTVLTTVSLAIAVTMVVVAITLQQEVDVREQSHSVAGVIGLASNSSVTSSIGGRVTHVVWILGAVLVVLAGTNAIFTTWATVIDARRPMALARALGATPRQVSAGLTSAQLLAALVAACVGVPAGLGLYQLAGGNVAKANPSILGLLAVLPCTLVAVALFTFIPARAGARRSVAGVLRSE